MSLRRKKENRAAQPESFQAEQLDKKMNAGREAAIRESDRLLLLFIPAVKTKSYPPEQEDR